MLDLKHSTYINLAKGSAALKDSLVKGNIKAIADQFELPYDKAYAIIIGKQAGDPRIIECAERIAAYYKDIQLTENVEQIIKSYGSTN